MPLNDDNPITIPVLGICLLCFNYVSSKTSICMALSLVMVVFDFFTKPYRFIDEEFWIHLGSNHC